jgi:aspartokinase
VETVAVYWEDRIKTYGFSETRGLAFLQWSARPEDLSRLGTGIGFLENSGVGMLLVLGQTFEGGALELGLLVEGSREEAIRIRLEEALGEGSKETVTAGSPAGLIHFYGPHFGDRYGIADAALKALAGHAISILAVGCSASSIYLVLPEEHMDPAGAALRVAFWPPGD